VGGECREEGPLCLLRSRSVKKSKKTLVWFFAKDKEHIKLFWVSDNSLEKCLTRECDYILKTDTSTGTSTTDVSKNVVESMEVPIEMCQMNIYFVLY